MEVQETVGEIENGFKGNPKNSKSSIAWCLCYNVIPLVTNKAKPRE